jgi:hypothetical protein
MSIIKLNNRALRSATTVGTTTGLGDMTFISKATASSSSTISITSGIDSTYKEYLFIFKDIHPGTDGSRLKFQADTGTNTNYNQTVTSLFFYVQQGESDDTLLAYGSGQDQTQGTAFQDLSLNIDSDGNDSSLCGYLHIFNPSSSTFVKHFIGTTQCVGNGYYSFGNYSAGYFNTTTAITRFQFKMSSGNIDAGTISLYGIN